MPDVGVGRSSGYSRDSCKRLWKKHIMLSDRSLKLNSLLINMYKNIWGKHCHCIYRTVAYSLVFITWKTWLMLGWTWASSVPRWPRRPMASWLVSELALPARTGKWSSLCTQPWWGRTSSTAFSFGPFTTRKTSRPWNLSREGQQSCEGSGAQTLWRAAEGAGVVQSREEEAEGRPCCSL